MAMKRLLIYCLIVLASCVTVVQAYRTPPPKYVVVDLTWKDAKTGQSRTMQGQLWFADLPMVGPGGRIVGLGSPDHFQGIRWVVPKSPGDIWIARGTNTNPATFTLHDYYGEREVVLAFDRVDVSKIDDMKMESLMAEKAASIDSKETTRNDKTMKLLVDMDLVSTDDDTTMNTSMVSVITREGTLASTAGPSPLRFASSTPLGIKSIPISDLQKIVFLHAENNMAREVYRGRFVEFSNGAVGDAGRVRVVSSTFFGGPNGDEAFNSGHILNDGTVLMSGDFRDLDFVDPKLIRVVGEDPGPGDYPVTNTIGRGGRPQITYPRRTVTLVHYSKDLQQIAEIVRMPWGFGTAGSRVLKGPDEALYISGGCGPHMDEFVKAVPRYEIVENPDAVKAASERNQEPGGDGFVVKLAPGLKSVEWLVRFKHAYVEIFLRPDGKILVNRNAQLFFIEPDGKPTDGPKLERTAHQMAVDPNTGDIYFGGNYRSGTGLEPYVCPCLYKLDANGKMVWTAYSWSGPIAGVEQLRLVSDSSITRVKVGEDGNLALVGWSDGGNTTLAYQPYDARKLAPSSGFCSSVWGADGTTVRIGHIIHMDGKTMEVDYCTKYLAYRPVIDIPAILNIYSTHPLPNGDVAVTGSAGQGFVETHDAWYESWYIQSRTNEFAVAKSGTFFTLFRRGFESPRMATRMPGLSGPQVTGRGKMLLIFSCSTEHPGNIIVKPYQKRFGGAMDAYVALVDTQGQANPPVIPQKTWGLPPKEKRAAK